jgi:CTP-dependent riboflavin kinase
LAELSGGAIKILIAIGSIIDESGVARTTASQLGRSIGISRRQCFRLLGELSERDVIVNESKQGNFLEIYVKRGITVGRNNQPKEMPMSYDRKWMPPTCDIPGTKTA